LFFKGDTIEMSSSEGTFDIARIDMCQTLVLIAAGTGITPMLRIINYVLQKDIDIVLLFFNKTQNDILCREELEIISNKPK
jgi:cytochrome-b5 reductase